MTENRGGSGRITLVLTVFILALLLSGCTTSKSERYVKTFDGCFDTVSTATLYAKNDGEAERFFDLFARELDRWSRLCDIYYEYEGINNLCSLNRAAGEGPIELDPDLLSLLSFAVTAAEVTGGTVDITLGPVLSLWHDAREKALADPASAALPDRDDLLSASALCRAEGLRLDPDAGTAELSEAGLSLDVGAIAKGYAAEQIARALRAGGYSDFALNLGGNLRVSGSGAGDGWSAAVRNPIAGGTVPMGDLNGDLSLVTSGSYQRYFTVDGVNYHHIIDPATLAPADFGWTSVSVLTSDSGVADVLSTALFCMSYEDGLSLLERVKPSVTVLWIDRDGQTVSYTWDGGGDAF